MPAEINDEKYIIVRGARVHNLKNIDINIERDKLHVITGLSGSGKSSLAFSTLFADGQRRYVESLSSYARQFLGKVHKPDVDFIYGIPPAIAIEQKVNTRNPRSTVGTSTEIYDYIKLLFARAGRTFSPVSGQEVKRETVKDVLDYIYSFSFPDTRAMLFSPHRPGTMSTADNFRLLLQQGFSRVEVAGELISIEEALAAGQLPEGQDILVLIDRVKAEPERANENRLADSVETAFHDGKGECLIKIFNGRDYAESRTFSNRFEADGISFDEPSVHTFTFNNPLGACPRCEGFGQVIGIDPDLVVPDKSKSVLGGAVACWKGEASSEFQKAVTDNSAAAGFPIHRPYYQLTDEQKAMLWDGCSHFDGINGFFAMAEANAYKIQYRVLLSRFRGRTSCPVCKGARLRPEALYVKVGGLSVDKLVDLPISELGPVFSNIELSPQEKEISKRILEEIRSRISFLMEVGLGYLTLNRLSSSLSGGESQRINLATSLGSSLVGSLYILDEPSIGLHSRDTELLIGVLRKLQELGNTVLVVEHDEDIMKAADEIIDMGPQAGINGGKLVFQGTHGQLVSAGQSLTAKYLTGQMQIAVPSGRRAWNNYVTVKCASANNLRGIDASFPLNVLCAVTGVSGSGKSTLVTKILYPALMRRLFDTTGDRPADHGSIEGSLDRISSIEFIDQNPIGKSSRSTPVTYSKAYDEIRKLFADQQAAKINGLDAGHFSFNLDAGRCPECKGEGVVRVEMQFMADVELVCEACGGRRFKEIVLDVKYRGKNISDVLDISVDEAMEFFSQGADIEKRIVERLRPLQEVGLGYVPLGQSSSSLSGGESQRIKLASFLGKDHTAAGCLFIFDEPTTGLHFHDIEKLLSAFSRLIAKGHSIIVIEHNIDVIKVADWVIDLGPEGGKNGGELVFAGTPEQLAASGLGYTSKYLADKLSVPRNV
jgi:excinuclease ABC subunit A